VAIIATSPGSADAHALLLRDVPRTSSITAVSAHYLLHTYLGGPVAWPGRVSALTPAQQDRLRLPAVASPAGGGPPLTDSDHELHDRPD
jgi:hypothetical protein